MMLGIKENDQCNEEIAHNFPQHYILYKCEIAYPNFYTSLIQDNLFVFLL